MKAHYLCTTSQVTFSARDIFSFFFCLLYFVTYSHILHQTYRKSVCQAKKVTKGLWLLAAVLSLPTAYARVNMEVIDRYKKMGFYPSQLKVGERVKAHWCVLDWDRPWLWRSHELYLLVTILVLPG